MGDPSSDLVIAWTLFHKESRKWSCEVLGLDEATWALWKAPITPSGNDEPGVVRVYRDVIDEVTADRDRPASRGA